MLFDLALARTCNARFGNDFTHTPAGGASLLNAEKALAHLYCARAVAGAAGFDGRTRLGTAAFAGFASLPGGDANLRIFAARCFFQRNLHGVAQVATAKYLTPAACAPAAARAALLAKHVTENIAKRLCKPAKSFCTRTTRAAHVRVHPGVTVLIIGSAFLRIRQHFISFFGFLEFLFGSLCRVTLIAVRVMLHRLFAIRLFNLFLGGVFRHAQGFVIVTFGHGSLRVSGSVDCLPNVGVSMTKIATLA